MIPPKGTIWQNPKVKQIRIKVWPLLGARWGSWKQWAICLVHNETKKVG